jgi:hypothetical protein
VSGLAQSSIAEFGNNSSASSRKEGWSDDDTLLSDGHHRSDRVDVSQIERKQMEGKQMEKAVLIVAAVSLMGGCTVYSDGRVAGAFDQGAIKGELLRAEKDYGNK